MTSRLPGRVCAVVVLTIALTGTGCSVTFGTGSNSPTASPSAGSVRPLVRDNTAELDLRSKPTRESLGFRPGSTLAAADRDIGSEGIKVHVVMPTGKAVDLLAYGVASEARRGLDPKGDRANPAPTQTIVNTRYPSPEAAQEALTGQADALGLSPDDVGRSAGGAQPGVIAAGVIQGLRQDWLAVEVEIRTQETAGEVQVNYQFEYDAQNLPLLPRS